MGLSACIARSVLDHMPKKAMQSYYKPTSCCPHNCSSFRQLLQPLKMSEGDLKPRTEAKKPEKEEEEEVDIDLNDPAVSDAAVKIQAKFRGMQIRKKVKPATEGDSKEETEKKSNETKAEVKKEAE